MTKALLKLSLKKDFAYKNILQNHCFFCEKSIFLSHNSYNIPQTIIFNISIAGVLVFSILNIIRMI